MYTKRNYQMSVISDAIMKKDAQMPSFEEPASIEQTLHDQMLAGDYEIATFGAGSFWRVEAIFRRVTGVIGTAVGYIGGKVEYPSYEQVSTGKTGHVEAVQVIFDPDIVPYEKLLELFWELHNPTAPEEDSKNLSSQYKSVIFYHNEKQRKTAADSKKRQEDAGYFKRDIVTEIVPVSRFFRAKEYHQQYYEKVDSGGHFIK
jgi:peptide-methionine (S)-S-oxide reductase